MKLRVRRRDNTAADASGGGGPLEGNSERSRESTRTSSRRKTSNKTSASSAAAASSSSSPPTTSSSSARAVLAAEETSPDSKCPICLDRFNNLAYLDHCLHRFCFPCIQEWSHNKAECPLCKQPFASILHSVRAEDDFKEYTLQPPPNNSSVAATVAMVAAMASAARSDHHMRLMLRRHRVADGGRAPTRRRRRERGMRGGAADERAGVWEFYLDPPPSFSPLSRHLSISNSVAEDSGEREELQEQRGSADASEGGVVFNQLTGFRGAGSPLAPSDRASRRLMTRLAARQRLQREGGAVRPLREREALAFRRMLYQCGVRVRGVAGVSGNQGQQCDITAESFRQNPAYLNRLRPWLRRELKVLYGSHGSLVDIVQRIIVSRLARHGLTNPPTLEEELRPFLLARTEHFLHELVSFARSPLSMDSYDQQAVYEPPPAAMELDGLSSSSDGSSVIAISEEEEEEGGRSEGTGWNAHSDIIQTGSCLSLSAWDDETPGPSYSASEPSCSLAPTRPLSPAPQEPASEGGEDKQGEEECLIVGYKKPIAERTPELVQLSSDSEEEKMEKKEEEEPAEKAPPPPSPPPSSSYLPIIPPSTSGAHGVEESRQTDVETRRRRSRSRSGSSGRSRKSVCSVTSERQKRDDGQHSRRRKKRRGGGDRSTERPQRSGTFCNPNRSIYPPMMRRRSPLPFDSSADSCSPLPPSPLDSSPDFHCGRVSPLTSPSGSSTSSPLCFSPPRVPVTPSRSPCERPHHAEKPGGKRKYKSRHLNSKDPSWRPNAGRGPEKRKERKRRRERPRRDDYQENGGFEAESRRRSREDRSPSVEIIYEGTVSSGTTQKPAHKRRRRRHRQTQHSSSPVIITLDSDSSHEDANKKAHSGSSSPLSSQQTIDFSDLPPLPLVHSSSVGRALDADIGELPAEILDRGSDGSEMEALGPSTSVGQIDVNSDDSDVDVENLEDEDSPLEHNDKQAYRLTRKTNRKSSRENAGILKRTHQVHPEHGGASPSDRYLLQTILGDLNQISAARRELSFDPSFSPESRRRSQNQDVCLNEVERFNPSQGFTSQPGGTSVPPLKESPDVPPLLRWTGPSWSYSRNSPPPLRHKDAGSPQQSPLYPRELPTRLSDSPVLLDAIDKNPVSTVPLVPPIDMLKSHLLALRGDLSTRTLSSLRAEFPSSLRPVSGPSLIPVSDSSLRPVSDPFSLRPVSDPSLRPVSDPFSLRPVSDPSLRPVSDSSLRPVSDPFSLRPVSDPSLRPVSDSSLRPVSDPFSLRPVSDPSLRPVSDPSLKPVSDPSLKPVSDPSLRPVSDPSLRPVSDPSLRPVSDPSLKPVSDPSLKPVSDPSLKPVSDSTLRPVFDSSLRPVFDPIHRPVSDPSLKPVSGSSVRPVSGPSLRPVSDPSLRPVSDPSHRPVSDPSLRPVSDPSLRPVSDPSLRPVSDPSLRPVSDPSHRPVSDPSLRPVSDPSLRPVSDPSLRPVSDPSLRPVSGPSSRPFNDPSLRLVSDPSLRPVPDPPSLRPGSDPSLDLGPCPFIESHLTSSSPPGLLHPGISSPPTDSTSGGVGTVTPPNRTVTLPKRTVTPPSQTVTPPSQTVTPPKRTVTPPRMLVPADLRLSSCTTEGYFSGVHFDPLDRRTADSGPGGPLNHSSSHIKSSLESEPQNCYNRSSAPRVPPDSAPQRPLNDLSDPTRPSQVS